MSFKYLAGIVLTFVCENVPDRRCCLLRHGRMCRDLRVPQCSEYAVINNLPGLVCKFPLRIYGFIKGSVEGKLLCNQVSNLQD